MNACKLVIRDGESDSETRPTEAEVEVKTRSRSKVEKPRERKEVRIRRTASEMMLCTPQRNETKAENEECGE